MTRKKLIILIVIILSAAAAVIFIGYRFSGKREYPDYHKAQQEAQENIGPTGEYQTDDFDPTEFLTTWNFNNLPAEERAKFYKETQLPNGALLREYNFFIEDKEIEVAPGVFFPA